MSSHGAAGIYRRGARGRAVITLAVGLSLLAAPGASAAVPTQQGLFVQVGSLGAYSPAQVQAWMARSCKGRDLVLQDVAGEDGRLFQAYLDVITPYAPGGARACFNRAFIGTVDLAWRGGGSKYVEGVQDPSFSQRYLSLSSAVARAFVARYPRLRVDWYLTYEADLNQLYYPSVQQAYKTMLSTEMRNLRVIRPGAVMWSPTFAYPYAAYSGNTVGMTQLRANLLNLFTTLNRSAGGLQFLDLQDFVAGSGCQPSWNRMTPQDAVGWVNFLAGLQQIPTVELNVEQYAVDCATGTNTAGNPVELAARTSYYRSRNILLGPAFEIRYWLQNNGLSLAA
jgi:hypothetical protein